MEYFGFSLYVGATVTAVAITGWAIVPDQVLPSRWWAVAVPAWILVLLGFVYVALASYNNEVLTLDVTQLETITDGYAKVERDKYYEFEHSNAVLDLPLASVNRVLYSMRSN